MIRRKQDWSSQPTQPQGRGTERQSPAARSSEVRKNDSLEAQSVQIQSMVNKIKSVSGTVDARITTIYLPSRLEEAYDVDEKCFSLYFSQIPHDVHVRDFETSPQDNWHRSVQVDREQVLRKGESAHALKGIPSLACKMVASGSAYKGDTFGAKKLLQHSQSAGCKKCGNPEGRQHKSIFGLRAARMDGARAINTTYR